MDAPSSRLTILFAGLGLGASAITGILLLDRLGAADSGVVLLLELLTVPAMLLVAFGISDSSSLSEH